jgi:hypothetical protein
VNIDELKNRKLAFDHDQILADYREWRKSGGAFWSSKRRNY